MLRLSSYFVLFFFFGSCGRIYWDNTISSYASDYDYRYQTYKNIEHRKLNWSDFPGRIDPKSRAGAAIFWDICYTLDSMYIYSNPGEDSENWVHANINVFAGVGSLSWIDTLFKKSGQLINHEQRHYDIAKIYAEKFRKIIPSLPPFSRFNCVNRIDSAKAIVKKECMLLQAQYDSETEHGIQRAMQEKWDKKIDILLKK